MTSEAPSRRLSYALPLRRTVRTGSTCYERRCPSYAAKKFPCLISVSHCYNITFFLCEFYYLYKNSPKDSTVHLCILVEAIRASGKPLFCLWQVSLFRLYLHAERRTASKHGLIHFQPQIQKRVIRKLCGVCVCDYLVPAFLCNKRKRSNAISVFRITFSLCLFLTHLLLSHRSYERVRRRIHICNIFKNNQIFLAQQISKSQRIKMHIYARTIVKLDCSKINLLHRVGLYAEEW